MVGLGIIEILILLVIGLGCVGVVALVVVAALVSGRRPADPSITFTSWRATDRRQGAATPAAPDDSHIEIVARLTNRFCPQCRAALPADSPEGLCPACLLAGAMGEAAAGSEAPVHGDAVTTPPSGSRPPLDGEIGELQQYFPQLEILELLGRGGMGAVFKARQKNLDRLVALKVIPPDAAKDPAFAERFAREARAMARLNHPNIVTVYDYGEAGGTFWLLMEYIDGVNLRQTLRAGRLSPAEALAIVPPVCDALQYAHDQGIVHRDIKPENVLLDRSGRVKIADFGLAKLLGKGPDDFTLTRTQQVMGTPRYMAPEQIEKPTSVDHRADIYSLGVMIYEMLTGELPMGRFALPSERVQVDVRIDQVVLRALEKEPDRRYQRASQVKTELATASSWPAGEERRERDQRPPSLLSGEGSGVRGDRPTWRTPAYASKSDPAPLLPAGVPLGLVLAVAFGMVLGVLLIAGGLAAGVYAMTWGFHSFTGEFWGWIGGAFGCIVGGFGSLAGSYNTYRQLAGAEDLMRSPRTTWFDWVMRGYLLLGIASLGAGFYFIDPVYTEHMGKSLLTLGSIATLQAALFLIIRVLLRAPKSHVAARSPVISTDPRLEPIRRRVAGPAIGLMIVGLLGFFPLCLGLLALPVFVIMPAKDEIRHGDSPWDQKSAPTPIYEDTMEAKQSFRISVPAVVAWAFPPTSLPILLAQESVRIVPFAWIFIALIAVPANFVISLTLIVGGWRMRQLKSYGLAMIATIMAMLPCTAGWLLGLPIGLWSLVTLMQAEVREAFES